MNEDRRKQLCDAIISHLNSNPDTRHFGRESLVDLFRNRAERAEIIAALDWLREKKYIKKLGAHTIGFGTGEGLNVYPMGDYDPFSLKSLEVKPKVKPAPVLQRPANFFDQKLKEINEAKAVKAKSKTDSTAGIEPIPQFVKTPIGKVALLCETAKPIALKAVLNDEINSIEQALNKTVPTVEQRYEKIGVLTRLSLIFNEQQPEVSALLDGIVTDFIELTEVMV